MNAADFMDMLKRAEREVNAENKAKAKRIAQRRQQAEYEKHLKELEQ